MPTFATSGAITLSDPARLDRLFWPLAEGIEIGNLPVRPDLDDFLARCRERGRAWAIHSPLLRGFDKLAIAGAEGLAPAAADLLSGEAALAARAGADYLLLHYPWTPDDRATDVEAAGAMRGVLADLDAVAARHGVQLMLEAKLGVRRNPGAIAHLARLGPGVLAPCPHLRLCLDLGDWWIAARALGRPLLELAAPWLPRARVFHVHGVWEDARRYLWTPLRPDDAIWPETVALLRRAIDADPARWIVYEYTPHRDPGEAVAMAGLASLRRELRA